MSTENQFRLLYFPVMAIGEPIRYLLSYGNIKFDDIRLDPNKWKYIKDTTPFGQMPVLEIGENIVGYQSVAICRYLGNLLSLAGTTNEENLDIDAIVDTIAEFRTRISMYNKEDNSGPNKQPLREQILNEVIPFYMKKFDENANGGHMVLNKLTWADIFFVATLDYCNGVMKNDIIKDYENLNKVRTGILEIPSIKDWIERRPVSDY